MANNVAITAGSGTSVATDDVSAVHYQRVKLVDGTEDSSTVIVGDADGLWVKARRDALDISVQSGGLTTSTTAYSAGDQVGTQFTFANAARNSGGTGIITGVRLISAADIIGPYDIVITDSSITLASDNAAYAISDGDSLKIIQNIQMAGAWDLTNNRICQAINLAIPYTCSGGTSLYGGLIARSGHTFFGATTDLQVILTVERN